MRAGPGSRGGKPGLQPDKPGRDFRLLQEPPGRSAPGVFNRPCRRTADDRAWFAPELARFSNDAASSEALTELIRFDDVDHGIERLYLPR
jgi:hypothetical protein